MHPTADTLPVIGSKGSGRRVIGGVMAPLPVLAGLRAASAPLKVAQRERYPRGAEAAAFPQRPFAFRWPGAGGGDLALRHNKRMHATRDTPEVMLRGRGGRARDARRYTA